MDLARITKYFFRRGVLTFLLLLAAALQAAGQYDKDVFSFRGRRALQDGKNAEAIQNFNILAQLDTTDYWTFFFRGIAKYNLGDIRGAHKDFNTAVRLNPVFTSGYHYRAIVNNRSGRYDEALKDLEKAISLRPGNIGLYFSRGVTYFFSRQFDLAVKDFDKFLKKEPKESSAYLNRGACYLFLGDTLKAVNDYNKAIKLDRFEPEGYIRRARLYAEQGRSDEAIADLDKAVSLDSTSSFAYFNPAILYNDKNDLNSAMRDLNKVLELEPGNALTLYNRSLIYARVGNYAEALEDMDRVININPGNVLAYYNRAAFFAEMGRWQDALDDYDKAMELYPDFAKAYMNRSYVKLQLGMNRESRSDYNTAQQKVREYRNAVSRDGASFADTTKKYSALLTLDAQFAKKDFDNELLQHRDVDVNLRPMYRVALSGGGDEVRYALERRYENAVLSRFRSALPVGTVVSNARDIPHPDYAETEEKVAAASLPEARREFLTALNELEASQFNASMMHYDAAVEGEDPDPFASYYKAFYYMNRGVLRSDMIDFIASMDMNVQTLRMDDKGTARARVRDHVSRTYDYSEAVEDMQAAAGILDLPYIWYNLGNLYCLSSEPVEAIESYDRALKLYPEMADAYFNRGLVLIYVKDKEKGCIDLSRAGELGIDDAYGVIAKYCEEEQIQ